MPSARTPPPAASCACGRWTRRSSRSWQPSSRQPVRPRSSAARAPIRRAWAALVELAERLVAPVFQESFGARPGFPQDHPHFAGFLPADRPRLRERLAPFDAVLVLGAGAFRQSPWTAGRFTEPSTRLALVSDDPAEVHRSPVELAILAPPGPSRGAGRASPARHGAAAGPVRAAAPRRRARRAADREPRARGARRRLPAEAILVEEAPVDRPEIHDRLLARTPLGFVSAAMGGLGFGVPAAAGPASWPCPTGPSSP